MTGRSGFYRGPDGRERIWYSPQDIEKMMEDALATSQLFPAENRPDVDIERFIQSLGVRMDQHAELEPNVLGLTEFYKDRPPQISINRDLTGAIDNDCTPPGLRGRWRATMAHEASHVVLHRVSFEVDGNQRGLFDFETIASQSLMRCLKSNVLFRGATTNDWREIQANMGMAALLMPETLFRRLAGKAVDQHRLTPDSLTIGSAAAKRLASEMAELFDVSKQAAAIRLETLGFLLSPAQPLLTR